MDRRSFRSGSCNGGGKSTVPASSPAAVGSRTSAAPAGSRTSAAPAAGSKEDAGAGERKALLPRHLPGGTARKGQQRGPKRRVQWKDSHGKKLAEVLEFQPSDSSDSDDEYLDTCICRVM